MTRKVGNMNENREGWKTKKGKIRYIRKAGRQEEKNNIRKE